MVAVSGLEPHPITTNVSLTFFPGVRPLELLPTASSITAVPLIRSSKTRYTRPVEGGEARQVGLEALPATATANPSESQPQPHILAVAVEGSWATMVPDTRPFRVVVVGDADFASKSFFPYIAN